MPNVKSTIDAHNKRLLKQPNSREAISDTNLCNCCEKEDCPLENQCLTKGIVYQATVTTEQGSESYVGLTDTDFKSSRVIPNLRGATFPKFSFSRPNLR